MIGSASLLASRPAVEGALDPIVDRLPPRSAARSLAVALGPGLQTGDVYAEGGALAYEALVAGDESELPQMLDQTRNRRGNVLDLGCGSGRLSLPFLARGHRVSAVDSSGAMLARLSAKRSTLPSRLRDRLELIEADMSRLPPTDRRYGAILLGTTTVTLLDGEERARTFETVRRLLAPGGRFLISTLWFPEQAIALAESVNVVALGLADRRTLLVTVFEQVDLTQQARHVTLLVHGALDEPLRPALYTSRPSLLPEHVLRAELEHAGLRVVCGAAVPCPQDGRQVVLLCCEAADDRVVSGEGSGTTKGDTAVPGGPKQLGPPVWEFLTRPSQFGQLDRSAVRASGVHLTMADGRTLLCGTSGLWNVNFGYGRPEVRRAVATALDEASYLTLFRYGHLPATRAARGLLDAAGPVHFGRVVFATSGGAANDLVMKLCRQWAQLRGDRSRRLVVGLRGSYHGLTYGSHGLSGEDLGQDVYGVDQRLIRHVAPEAIDELVALCEREGERICGLVLEPVLGSGCQEISRPYIDEIGRLADEYGFLVVADEVATGYHRTGPFTASASWARPPDLLILSKGLTNGACAASCVLVSHAVCEEFDRHDAVLVHGETQAGTPATAAAITAVLEMAADSARSGDPDRIARRLAARLEQLARQAAGLVAITGRGCFRGVVVTDGSGALLDPAGTASLVDAVREAGAVVHPGPHGVQLVPALSYTDEQVDLLVDALTTGLDRLWTTSGGAPPSAMPAYRVGPVGATR
ncbi:MAG: aminotransferase class III-fold pyridoxal phosphate-dependent enzyme [Actinomycetota bacterium]|nr:aminotransferase class III-fold pyridoxal phosphate-dependent enzyme [Actinomycetota bacterium]